LICRRLEHGAGVFASPASFARGGVGLALDRESSGAGAPTPFWRLGLQEAREGKAGAPGSSFRREREDHFLPAGKLVLDALDDEVQVFDLVNKVEVVRAEG